MSCESSREKVHPDVRPSRPGKVVAVAAPLTCARFATHLLVPFLALLAALLLALPAPGQAPPRQQPASDPGSAAESYFTNVELVDQHGESRRLYRDLLQGKVVIIDTMFTECTGVCPVMSKTFQKIQEHVGDRLGEDVHMLSFSVDPETDTPEKLREYAERWEARPGWYFLTGEPDNVFLALRKLGGYVEDRDAHNTVIIIGNEPTGLWKKALGLAPSHKILPIVDSVLQDEGSSQGS